MVQGWAGAQYGNMMIPRIGHEVLVKFLNGDPDQPIVVGRTYHSTTEPPYELPKHKTRMTIKSKPIRAMVLMSCVLKMKWVVKKSLFMQRKTLIIL